MKVSIFPFLLLVLLFAACGKGTGVDRSLSEPSNVVLSMPSEPLRPDWVRGSGGSLLTTVGVASGESLLWYGNDQSYVSQRAAPGGVSAEALQVVQREDLLHFVLVDRKHYDLYYGKGTTAAQSWTNLYPGLNHVGDFTLLFDPLNAPWILFADETSGALMAFKGSPVDSNFRIEKVASGQVQSLAAGFDPSGRLYVAWSSGDSGLGLQLSTRIDGRWQTATLDKRNASSVTLEMGPKDDLFLARPRIAWQLADGGELMYAELLSGGWTSQMVQGGGRVGADPGMAVDPLGGIWLCSTDQDRLDLVGVRRYPEGGWVDTRIDTVGATGFWPDIIEVDGSMQILFWNQSEGTVQLVSWEEF